jgi:photosystem II stability/assembly factor-like uncharacterized protein
MDVSFADRQNGWAVGFDGVILHTTNGGRTWNLQPGPGASVALLGVQAISSTTAWISGGPAQGYVARTLDSGTTWTQEVLPGNPLSISAVEFRTADEGWAAGYIGVWHRTA